jgi:para-aminobenzoate synthetase component I
VKYTTAFTVDSEEEIKQKMLCWVNQFSIFCMLDNQQYQHQPSGFECMLAAGARRYIKAQAGQQALAQLRQFAATENTWLFGHLAYDIKNELEPLQSQLPDEVAFDDLFFFEPEILLVLHQQQLTISAHSEPHTIFEAINQCLPTSNSPGSASVTARTSRLQYLQTVKQLQGHIARGDCYEINFCQEFFASDCHIDATATYQHLASLSPAPFAAFYRLAHHYCICASPERYFKLQQGKVITQPIKGTARRVLHNSLQDQANLHNLRHSSKEQSENVMVVDLVRNDLSRICLPGTVKVDELFGLYSFPQVHQMISTVSGQLPPQKNWIDVIAATFPMGSMTGAPKKKVMELIEQYETRKRGLFSGTIGYVKPNGDADFNVVIRSLLYNQQNNYLSFETGSAITFYSDAAQEYEECLLKAAAIKKILEQ